MTERKTILIVEDNIAISTILQRTCEKNFPTVTVHTAENGQVGLSLIQKKKDIDLIICDLMMPEMSGFDMIETVKSNPEYKHIPIIICTALADKNNVLLGMRAGANDFVAKPVPQKVLLEKITKFLDISPVDR